jgi:hypothetical protein
MNTRIQTLLAKFKETESTHRGAECLAGLDEIEKFAELILQEATDIVYDMLDDNTGAEVVVRVKEHFGVE